MKSKYLLLAAAGVLSLAGCDLFDGTSDTSAYVPPSAPSATIESKTSETSEWTPGYTMGDADFSSYNEEGQLEIIALEMSGTYGDGTLIQYRVGDSSESFDILVDAGPNNNTMANAVSSALEEFVTDHVLDMVVLSHEHTDHYGGFRNQAIQNGGITEVKYVVDNGVSGYNSTYQSTWEEGVREYWVNRGAEYLAIQDILESGNQAMQIDEGAYVIFLDTGYYPEYESTGTSSNPNLDSIAMCVRAGGKAVYMSGDMGIDEAEASTIELNSDEEGNAWFLDGAEEVIYKAAHHGAISHGANSSEYIRWINPSWSWASAAITTANQGNSSYSTQHPYDGALQRIAAAIASATGLSYSQAINNRIYFTGTTGNLHFEWEDLDGDISIYGDGRKLADYYDKDGNLVDPEDEKDLPYYQTAFAAKQ